jgi:hypothetical protein
MGPEFFVYSVGVFNGRNVDVLDGEYGGQVLQALKGHDPAHKLSQLAEPIAERSEQGQGPML